MKACASVLSLLAVGVSALRSGGAMSGEFYGTGGGKALPAASGTRKYLSKQKGIAALAVSGTDHLTIGNIDEWVTALEGMLTDVNGRQDSADETNSLKKRECEDQIETYTETILESESDLEAKKATVADLESTIATDKENMDSFGEIKSEMEGSKSATQKVIDELKDTYDAAVEETKSTIVTLEKAIELLEEATASNADAPPALQVAASLISDQLLKHPSMLRGALSLEQQRTASQLSMLRGGPATTYHAHYEEQSDAILGILRQMLDAFKSDQEKATVQYETKTDEQKRSLAIYTKESTDAADELTQLADKLAGKENQLTAAEDAVIAASEKLHIPKEGKENKEIECKTYFADYEEETKTRTDEIASVKKAIRILGGDEALGAFERLALTQSYAPYSFVQVGAQEDVLPFLFVHNEIEKMIADLQKEMEDDETQLELCNEKLKMTRDDLAAVSDEVSSLEDSNTTLQGKVSESEGTIATAVGLIKEKQEDLKTKGEDRAREDRGFQLDYAKAKDHQILATRISDALASVDAATDLVTVLNTIGQDAEDEAKETITDEDHLQGPYQQNVHNIDGALATYARNKLDAEKELADYEIRLSEDKKSLASSSIAEKLFLKEQSDLQANCDFIISNFNTRRDAINTEVSALVAASQIMATISSSEQDATETADGSGEGSEEGTASSESSSPA